VPLTLSLATLAALEALRAARNPPDPVERAHDAFLLFGGMGPCVYLRRSGAFLVGADELWGEHRTRAASPDEACAALVIAAHRLHLPALLALLPARPDSAADCSHCQGQRWSPLLTAPDGAPALICPRCHGRGWLPREPLAEPSPEPYPIEIKDES
jgi:hypothetical protein